ncbi:RNA helicase [Malassezia arunalokei]|uniref:RNA helicase n=1 Tax=Malassezia arunalokei TaxID=1514897 RepID=A0AAJ5YYE7_9BASI|nr:RNA helicase [Malassezia arunalokei]
MAALGAIQEHFSSTPMQVQEAFMQLELIRSITDLRVPALAFANARSLTRQIHLHVGPTNSGKTHGALVTLSRARTGMYAGPLRLLAHEVWERMNQGTISPGIPPRACNLRTGEEVRTVDEYAGLVSCTVEMADVTRPYDVAVIDEIQMIADPQRGFAWTHAVLGLPAKELHLCGEASTVPLIQHLAKLCGDDLHVHNYERLTPLHVAPHSLYGDLGKVQRGDCIVAFKRSTIFRLKEQIEARTGLQCALAYGALPPETKSEQAKLFNAGKLDVMVASDAIGMGLNLRIKRVIFDTLSKWNGTETVPLSLSQIKQIAGRAGRYGTSRDASPHGLVLTRHEDEMDILRAALAAPVRSVTHALIQPSKQKLESLSFLLPRSRPKEAVRRGNVLQENSMSSLLEEFHAMADLDAGIFAMSDFVSQQAISALIEHRGCGLLTHAEKETWSNTPVNVRDERAMAWVGNAIEKYARGELVEFEACAKDLGTLEVEEAVTQIAADAEARRKAAKSTQPLAMWVQQDETILHVDTLMLLESLHRSLTIYLWLGFRFPLSFCFRHHVAERKRRTEASIEFCLEVIRIRRAQRLTYLGRDEEAKKLLQKHIEKRR